MTLSVRDQKTGSYNKLSNAPLHMFKKETRTTDIWKKLHRGEPAAFTWRKGGLSDQEKRLDTFFTNKPNSHITCLIHEAGSVTSDHCIVETIQEWNPAMTEETPKVERRRVPTNLTTDELKTFNDGIRDCMNYTARTLTYNPLNAEVDASAETITKSLIEATDQIVRQRTVINEEMNHTKKITNSKEWGLERKRRSCIHKEVEALTKLKQDPNMDERSKNSMIKRINKATVLVPGFSTDDISNKSKCSIWINKRKKLKSVISRSMRKLKLDERKLKIKKLIAYLQKEGNIQSRQFYARIRAALWGKKEQSVRFGTRKGTNGETITITKPEEVKKYIKITWENQFKAKPLPPGGSVDSWIGPAKRIQGDTTSIMSDI